MKLFFTIFLGIIFCGNLFSQNLVINGSFENYDTCPYNLGQLDFVNDVYNPNTNTPDYLHSCASNSTTNVFTNFWGGQIPAEGNGFVSIGMNLNGNNIKEYVTLALNDTLEIGKKYVMKFYISLADTVKYSIHQIGAYFHDSLINQNDPFTLDFSPQIENPSGNFISNKLEWISIEGIYFSQGGERFITIGNFYPDSLTEVDTLIQGAQISCYYIDNVYVGEYIEPVFDENKLEIYPNPSNDIININYELKESGAVLRIYNIIGQIVKEENLIGNNGVISLDVSVFSNGMYFATLSQNEKRLIVKKINIIG